ncbi:MAG: electron transport complex subunit RsxC [Bacteroidales bacterium]|nr:electron transport complex subunit RsxC [Bacteroidales bacterium]MCF8386372.1 electron transport complex subunit RsxC [Bacteroidales bacterium]MCF8396786.1 electron transport complex subunit RsxC [Bacteroidales bacterium]
MKTFKLGGVHPPENKFSAESAIRVLDLPKQVSIPLAQNLGAPAKPVVNKGDEVKAGQLIAKGEAFISANVHASVSGKVFKIDEVMDQSGYRRPAVIINVEGDEWEGSIDKKDILKKDISLSKEEIIGKIKEAGIVGLGGATFPSHVKLMVPEGKKAEVLIINGVECEPYLTSDHRLMLEKAEEIMIGTSILMKGLGVEKAYIGIENNKPDAIEKLGQLCKQYEGIEVYGLKVKYPQGGEKQLIKALTGREVPSGKLPIEVGCVVNNVGTAFAVYEAVQKNKPLFERIVTVTGKNLNEKANFLVRVGTPVSDLIKAVGDLPEDTGKVVSGGPMMGKALNNVDVPVVKGTSGILLFDEKHASRVEMRTCIRCAKCIHVCPMGLEPILLAQYSEKQRWEDAEKGRIMDCIECGSCQYTCPSGRPLLDYIRLGKQKVGQLIRNRGNK